MKRGWVAAARSSGCGWSTSSLEMAFVAERPHIQLEAFQFDAFLIRDVVEDQRGEVGLAGLGARAGELRESPCGL